MVFVLNGLLEAEVVMCSRFVCWDRKMIDLKTYKWLSSKCVVVLCVECRLENEVMMWLIVWCEDNE